MAESGARNLPATSRGTRRQLHRAMTSKQSYQAIRFPKMRRFALDAGGFGRRRHIVNGLMEVDVRGSSHQGEGR